MPAGSLVSKAWAKYGIDFGTFLVIAKGALPAVICVAMYEATPVANFYTTLGYLNSIVAALSFSFLPRAKFLQMSVLNAIGICIGAAFSLLLMYCATQARVHTTPPEEMAQLMQALSESASDPSQGSILSLPYNSSASAVCGIWLFFGIWISTSMRARRPQLIFPVVMFSIVINVSATYGTLLPTMEMCEPFVREVLLSMLTGLGVSFGVGIFFIPITSRVSARKMIVGYITLLKQTIRAEQEQVKLLKSRRIYRVETSTTSVQMPSNKRPSVEDTLQQLASTHRALEAEINCIAREVEFNKLSTDNFREIFSNLGAVAFQIRGLDTIADALEQNATIQEQRMNEGSDIAGDRDSEESHNSQLSVAIYRNANTLFTEVAGLVEESLDHFLITFQMGPSSLRKKQQHNGTADDTRDPCYLPGGGSFSTYLEQRLHSIHTQALENLQNVRLLSQRQHKGGGTEDIAHGLDGSSIEELYLLLHMQAMLQSTGKCALIFIQAADRIRGDEKAFKNALRYPTLPTLKLWMGSLLATHTTDVYNMDRSAKSTFGDRYHGMRDPEREHPETWWELFVSGFEKIYRFLGSEDSQLGFRAACATMSIAIVAFLASSQVFFIKQRLIWATITVPVALTTSSGSATRGLFWRVVGTVAAMVLSIVNYYIVDGRTAGIIVFLFVFLCFDMYIMVKFPRYLIAGLLGLVTQVLIIGYELQVRKIGQQVAETSGQPVYPIYEIAPYRLLAVIGGCFSAFIWTIFPSAVTDAYRIRTKLGLSLDLLAQYYTCSQVVWDIDLRALAEPDSPAPNAWQRDELVKMRTSVFSEILVLLEEVKQHLNDSFWDPRLGGKFPTKKYREITYQIQSIVSHLGLISTTANLLPDALKEDARPKSDTDWRNTLVQLLLSRRSDEVICTFSMLASSLSDGKPLPPCSVPALYNTSPDTNHLLSLGHMAEPGFIVYAAPRVVSELWRNQLQSVIENVRYLVGEFRFSILDSTYHA